MKEVEGLPERLTDQCGSRDGISLGATAALAPLVQAWFDRWGLSEVTTPEAIELRSILAPAKNFNIYPGRAWESMSPEDRVAGVLSALKAPTQPLEFADDARSALGE